MSEELKPKLDDFTAKVVADPAKPQETLLLQGFLGASSQPDHTRVYSDLTLVSYVDVANADIVHVEQLPRDQSPLGGSYLWVKKQADVLPGTGTGELGAKAKFLQGPIVAEAPKVGAPANQPGLFKTIPVRHAIRASSWWLVPTPLCRAVSCRRRRAPRDRPSAISSLPAPGSAPFQTQPFMKAPGSSRPASSSLARKHKPSKRRSSELHPCHAQRSPSRFATYART